MSSSPSYDPINKIWSGPSNPPIYNSDVGLGYLILNLLKITPNRVIEINADDGVETTCGQMFEKTVKIAKFLSSIGLKENDVVGVVARNSINLTPIVFACLTLGLPINALATNINESDITYMYAKTKPKLIFCDADCLEMIEESLDKIPLRNCKIITLIKQVENYHFVDEIIEASDKDVDDFDPPIIDSSTYAFITGTSGTTSNVKGACKSHKQFIENFQKAHSDTTKDSEVIYFTTPLCTITSSYCIMLSALYGMKRVISTKVPTPENFMEIMEKYKVTMTLCPPVILNSIKRTNFKPLECVRTVIAGAMVLHSDFMREIKILFPNARIVCVYASTEGDIVTFIRKNPKDWSSGQVSCGYQMKILDNHGNNLGPNEPGIISYKPRATFSNFYGDPEKYAETVKDGWIISGDWGYIDEEGFLYVIDRTIHLIKTTKTFAPLKLELMIDSIDGVISSCIVGVREENFDKIHAFVIKDPTKNIDEKQIKNFVNDRVDDFMKITGDVHFIEKFPTTPLGKVKKFQLANIAREKESLKE